MKLYILLFFSFNIMYFLFESFFNLCEKLINLIKIYFNNKKQYKNFKDFMYKTNEIKLFGFASFWMFIFPFGGLSAVLINLIYQIPAIHNINIFITCIFGMIIITGLEFLGGLFLDKCLKIKIWDYSDIKIKNFKLNVMGYIDIWHSIAWFFITILICKFSDLIIWLVK